MPCDSIINVTMVLQKASLPILLKAIQEVTGDRYAVIRGNTIVWNGGSYDKEDGELVVRNEQQGIEIKKAYSAELVKAQAKRFGWQVKEVGQYQYEIIKR